MAWLEKIDLAVNLNAKEAIPYYPFEAGRVYWQLDLDGRDAVEGLASHYMHDQNPGFFGGQIIEQLERQRRADVGSVAVYLAHDGTTDIAYAFIADDSKFNPTAP